MGIEDRIVHWKTLRTRGEIKRVGKQLDEDSQLRHQLYVYLVDHGYELDEEIVGKKLLRLLLDRSEEAQVRKNPIHINESFTCIFCNSLVPLPTSGIRDHCPDCLRGRHVDIVPGDRAANCRGMLKPSAFSLEGDVVWIGYECTMCTHVFRVRAHPEDQLPHSLSVADLPQRPDAVRR